MPEDTSNPFAAMIGALANKGGDKGVRKDTDGKVNPHLTPAEIARYEKIFGVMKKVVNPGPEAGKLDNVSSKVGASQSMQSVASNSGSGDIDIPGLGSLAAIGGAAAILGAALTTMSEDFMERVKELGEDFIEFGDSTGDEFAKLPAVAAKIARFLPIKVLKGLPVIGALFNFGFAIDHFNKEEWFDGGWELVSGILNFLPGGQFVSPLMDGYKIYAEILANKEAKETGKKPTFKDILGRQLKAIGTYVVDLIMDGKVPILSTFYKFGEGIGYMLTGDLSQGLESWTHILPSLLGGKESPVYKYVAEGLGVVWEMTKNGASAGYDKAVEWAGDAWGWVFKVLEPVGEVLKSFFDGIANWFSGAVNGAIDGINKFLPGDWQIPKFGDDEGDGMTLDQQVEAQKRQKSEAEDFVASIISRVGKEEYERMTQFGKDRVKGDFEEFKQFNDKRKAFYQEQRAIFEGEQQKVEDGIVHQNGRATRIDGSDAGLFAKAGGPIDKMLDQNSEVMKSIQSINAQQLNVLVEIRNGINALRSSGGGELSFAGANLNKEFFE